MKRKLLAIAMALAISVPPCITAGAYQFSNQTSTDFFSMDYQKSYEETYYGDVVLHTSNTSNSFLVVTDGTTLTEEDVQDLPDFKNMKVITWDEIERDTHPDLSIDLGTEVYKVWFTTKNHMQNTARQFQMEYDFVENVYFIRSHNYSRAWWEGVLELIPKDENAKLHVEDFPQLSVLELNEYAAWDNEIIWGARLTDELNAECAATCEDNSYDEYLFAHNIAKEILAEHSDILSDVKVSMAKDFSGSESNSTQSIWQSAGDPNADGVVNAGDAAEILLAAAESGTGAEVAVTAAADVNADGTVDAADASAVLVYAAAQGAGEAVEWVELLR